MSEKIEAANTPEKIDHWTRQEIAPQMRPARPLRRGLETIFGSVEKNFERLVAADAHRDALAGKLSARFGAPELSAYRRLTEAKLKNAADFEGRVRDLGWAIIFILGFGVFAAVVFAEPALLTGAFWLAAFIAATHIALATLAGRRRRQAEELHAITGLALDARRLPPSPE